VKTILISGTNGFLGGYLAESLKDKYQVITIPSRMQFLEKARTAFATQKIDIVIHAGWHIDFGPAQEQPTENISNTKTLLELSNSHNVDHFIFLSGGAVLGVSRTPIERTEKDFGKCDPAFPHWLKSAYVKEKMEAEALLSLSALPHTILYLTTCYGPTMTQSLLRTSALPLQVTPQGGSSYLDIRDFDAAIRLVLEKHTLGNYIVSSGNFRFRSYFTYLHHLTGKRKLFVAIPALLLPFVRKLPHFGARSVAAFRTILESSFGFKYYSNGKFKAATGWQPQYTLEATLRHAK
jgi:nucleoside-diphosphate-sugar epimerase